MQDLRDKLVLVTGASSGIGEALALAFARAGARLILTARDTQRLEAVRAECFEIGAQARVVAAEVTDEAQVQALADDVHAREGVVDVLVNNAGVVMGGLCWEVEPADWRRLHDINVMGVVHGIRAFVPRMIERGKGGHIVNMASVSGFVGAPGMATYSASKFAVVGLSESLRNELYRHRIGVSVVCPGFVKTPIQSKVKLVGMLDSPQGRARVDRDFARTHLVPEAVAERTLRAIRRNESIASIGREAVLARTLKRWAPTVLERVLRGS
jgi:NADP-dependent 3-hydroxy acid dehydrogenase YdfG